MNSELKYWTMCWSSIEEDNAAGVVPVLCWTIIKLTEISFLSFLMKLILSDKMISLTVVLVVSGTLELVNSRDSTTTNTHHHHPHFGPAPNITRVQVDSTAFLHCNVLNLQEENQVLTSVRGPSWIHRGKLLKGLLDPSSRLAYNVSGGDSVHHWWQSGGHTQEGLHWLAASVQVCQREGWRNLWVSGMFLL